MMKILFVGDVHGEFYSFKKQLVQMHEYYRFDAVVQLGDFGFYPSIMSDLLSASAPRFPVPVYAIDGNHEDHRWLASLTPSDHLLWNQKLNLHYLPRGEVLILDHTRIGVLGGALNVDRPQFYEQGIANYVTQENRLNAIESFNKKGIDLLVTHSAPSELGVGVQGSVIFQNSIREFISAKGFKTPPINDCGEYELNLLWQGLYQKPLHWIFGHFHFFYCAEIDSTRFWCLPEFSSPPLLIWDTQTRQMVHLL